MTVVEQSASSSGPSSGTSPLLSVSHLYVEREGRVLLEDVSFDVARDSVLAIVGPNGAGKTTLLRVLLDRFPHRGEVRWTSPVRIGYVPQKLVDTDLPVSVEEFLSMKCPDDYAECLATVGLDRSLLPQPIGTLSGGEIQRALIAWAIVDRPQVLLFDEPTSNVDVGSGEVIYQALRRIRRDLHVTILLVTHDVHEVHHVADRVLVLDRTVLFDGPPDVLLADRELLARAFDLRSDEEATIHHERPAP